MKPLYKDGFTIIETMLFLGITGLLIVGILAGTGNSINIQRYRDSVTSFQSMFQMQYSNVNNVSNDSAGLCGTATLPVPRGQSNCVILGRFISTTDSKNFSIKTVIGTIPFISTSGLSDISIFLHDAYNIKTTASNSENYELNWDASIANTASEGRLPLKFSMLILRSPVSGTIKTFVSSGEAAITNESDIQNLVGATFQSKTSLCVSPNGMSGVARSAIVIDANASGASSIETLGEGSGC